MSRQSRLRATARRRATRGRPHPQRPEALAPACPHCDSHHVAWLTRAEFAQAVAAHGVELRPERDESAVFDGVPFPYWFCHDCESGGALVVF